MRRVLLLMVAAGGAGAQMLVGPGGAARAAERLKPQAGEEKITCDLRPIAPALSYSLRYLSGYTETMRLGEFRGSGHTWTTLLRVTPFLKDPVYLRRRVAVPDVPDSAKRADSAGGFFVGIGHYQVSAMVYDERGRACRNDWEFDVREGGKEGRQTMEPNTVAEMSMSALQQPPPAAAVVDRLTLLVNAGPLDARRVQMGARDSVTVSSAVAALLEKIPARTVRLVVFNLDRRRELFRREAFERRELDSVADAIRGVQLGLVDVHTLQDKAGDLNFLAALMNGELHAEKPSSLVVFLGPRSRGEGKIADGALAAGNGPPFFFVELMRRGWPFGGRGPGPQPAPSQPPYSAGAGDGPGVGLGSAGDGRGGPGVGLGSAGDSGGRAGRGAPLGIDPFPSSGQSVSDAISRAVAQVKGKTFRVTTPVEFARALAKIALPPKPSPRPAP